MSERLESIQVLRGVAAMMVFAFHLVVTVDRVSPADLRHYAEFGQFGVDLFFVISGFVMAFSVRDLSGRADAFCFLARRVWRIAPLLYVLTVARVFYSSLWGGSFDTAQIVNCFTIVPVMQSSEPSQYALVPAWTLGFEMTFYILVAATVTLRSSVLWAIAPLILLTAFPGLLGESLMAEFAYGILIFAAWEKGLKAHPALLLIAAAIMLAATPDLPRFLAWGVPAALILWAVLAWRPKHARIPLWLGTISYSLYLSHTLVFDALTPILELGGIATVVVGLAFGGLVIAWLIYEAIEAPLWGLRNVGRLRWALQS